MLVVAAVLLIAVLVFRNSIETAVKVIQIAAVFIDETLSIFIVPCIHLVTVTLILGVWLLGLVNLLSLGTVNRSTPNLPPYG